MVVGRNLALDWLVVGVMVSQRREGETKVPPPLAKPGLEGGSRHSVLGRQRPKGQRRVKHVTWQSPLSYGDLTGLGERNHSECDEGYQSQRTGVAHSKSSFQQKFSETADS